MIVRWINTRRAWFWVRVAIQVRGVDSTRFALFIAWVYATQIVDAGEPKGAPPKTPSEK